MEPSRMHITIRPIRKPKRFRSAFSTEQIKFLELQFKKFPYISSEHRKEIAAALNMQERAIKIWFQNRRMKEKKESINIEFDYVTTNKVEKTGTERLNNACTLPSTNKELPRSLPISAKPGNISTKLTRISTDSMQRGTRENVPIQQEPQNLSTNHIKPPMPMDIIQDPNIQHQPFLYVGATQGGGTSRNQFKSRNPPINRKSAELSVDLGKKMKRSRTEINNSVNLDRKPKVQRELKVHPSVAAKLRTSMEDLSSKKAAAPQMSSRPPKQAKVNGPSYCPVMPTMYAHPYMPTGSVIWKPINIMPVVAPGMHVPSYPQQSFGYDQKGNCNCNCHENTQSGLPNPINPYTQYVITAPAAYQNSSS